MTFDVTGRFHRGIHMAAHAGFEAREGVTSASVLGNEKAALLSHSSWHQVLSRMVTLPDPLFECRNSKSCPLAL